MSTSAPLFQPTEPFDHASLMRELTALTACYPFASLLYLGESILSRPIPYVRIGAGKRSVLYVGAHHGMEWITSALLVRFLWELCSAVDKKTRVSGLYPVDLCATHTLYVLPMLNPDGVEYQIHGLTSDNPLMERLLEMNGGSEDFSRWQANARGVDLNHNYDAGFAAYKELERQADIKGGAPTRYSGEAAESEPESAALATFIRFHRELCGVMTLHTQGEEIFCGGKLSARSRISARRLSELTGYRLCHAEGLAAYGGLTDWCVQVERLPAFTLECGRGENPLPLSQFFPIYLRLRGALFAFPSIL